MTATLPYCVASNWLQSWPLAIVLVALIGAGLVVWVVRRADKRDR